MLGIRITSYEFLEVKSLATKILIKNTTKQLKVKQVPLGLYLALFYHWLNGANTKYNQAI